MTDHQESWEPDWTVLPGDMLREELETRGMSQSELARRMGRPIKTINEIVNGKAALTPDTAIQLEQVLGIPDSFWNSLESMHQQFLARKRFQKKTHNTHASKETPMAQSEPATFDGWAILELLGHRRLGGYLTQQEIAGVAFFRIDVPAPGEEALSEAERSWVTQFYAPAAVYAITPVDEAIARAIAAEAPAPVGRWELRSLLPQPESHVDAATQHYDYEDMPL